MMLFEVFVPQGVLSEEQRHDLSRRLLTELIGEHEVSRITLDSMRAWTQVLVHEPDAWAVGPAGDQAGADAGPRYVVRLTVPGSWRKEMAPELVPRITRILAAFDPDPQRLYDEPHAWIHVVGVPEGSVGLFGRTVASGEIEDLLTKPFRESPDREAIVQQAAPGTAIDPICGATIELDDTAVTLEHDGIVYGFCCTGCRQSFATELGIPAA